MLCAVKSHLTYRNPKRAFKARYFRNEFTSSTPPASFHAQAGIQMQMSWSTILPITPHFFMPYLKAEWVRTLHKPKESLFYRQYWKEAGENGRGVAGSPGISSGFVTEASVHQWSAKSMFLAQQYLTSLVLPCFNHSGLVHGNFLHNYYSVLAFIQSRGILILLTHGEALRLWLL